jgi:hypothetical protein
MPLEGASHESMPFGVVSEAALSWFRQWLPNHGCTER